ncbi:MAG TPA: sigma-70 family RNA polymerase sigma factor [Streptosporangiaceae bacterium]
MGTQVLPGNGIVADRQQNRRRGCDLDELLHRAARRDWAAWDELVKRFGRMVLYTAGAVGLNASDSSDAAQLTWLRLHEHIHEIREPEHLPAWLAVTARREALRIAFGAKRYVLCAEPDTVHNTRYRWSTTDVYPVEGDYSPAVEAALSNLPTRYEQLLRLLMCDDCPSYTEVAEKMSIPIGSIGPMRMRALQILRQALELSAPGLQRGKSAASVA